MKGDALVVAAKETPQNSNSKQEQYWKFSGKTSYLKKKVH